MKTSPLMMERIPLLRETQVVEVVETTKLRAFIALLWEVTKAFSTHDLVGVYMACRCFPVQQG